MASGRPAAEIGPLLDSSAGRLADLLAEGAVSSVDLTTEVLARHQRPAGLTPDGLPLGAQLLGPANGEELLISLAAQLEPRERWQDRRPPHHE